MAVEASWLPDPGGVHELRYWDGAAWTEHVSDAGVVSVDSPVAGWPEPAEKKGFRDRLADAAVVAKEQAVKAKERHDTSKEARQVAAGAAQAAQAFAAEAARNAGEAPLLTVMSHDKGANATVAVFTNRVERVKGASLGSWSSARQDTEVIPIRNVSSVQVKKSGIRSNVTIYATGNTIEFRLDHGPAQQFKDLVMKLVLAGPTPQPAPMAQAPPPPAPAAPDRMAQLKELASLRDSGVLTEEEFAAEKARILRT